MLDRSKGAQRVRPRALVVGLLIAIGSIHRPAPARGDATLIGPGAFPRLAADTTGRLHLMYQDGGALYYRTFSGSWSAAEPVPGSTGVNLMKWSRHRMRISADGARVYASWGFGYDTDVWFGLRDGAGWHPAEIACSSAVRPWEYAAVAAQSNGDVYVFCQVDDLWVAHRSPAGIWDGPTELFTLVPSTAKHVVADTDSTDQVHAFFRIGPVQYLHGADTSWSPRYSLETAASTELPAFAIDDADRLHLVWQDWAHVGADWFIDTLRYATGADDSWSSGNAGVVVHHYVAEANPPEIAVTAASALVITWIEAGQVLYSVSTDGGASFSPAAPVATDARPVAAGQLEGDLRTPPSLVLDDTWHLIYQNDAGQLIHLVEPSPVTTTPDPPTDAGVAFDAAIPDGGTPVDAGFPTDGAAGTGADPNGPLNAGCGCSGGGGHAASWLVVLLLFGWSRRCPLPRRS